MYSDGSRRAGRLSLTGRGDRFLRFRNWLDLTIDTKVEGVLVYEDAMRYVSNAWAKTHAGLLGVAMSYDWRAAVPILPHELKKFATGDGRAGKPEMIRAATGLLDDDWCVDNFGYQSPTGKQGQLWHDTADAILLLEFLLRRGAPLSQGGEPGTSEQTGTQPGE